MMNSVKRILFRRSGTLNELRNAFTTAGSAYPGSGDRLGPAAGGLDLRLGRIGEGVRAHGERLRDFPTGEDLPLAPLVGQAMRHEGFGRDLAVEVLLEHLDVDRRVLHP